MTKVIAFAKYGIVFAKIPCLGQIFLKLLDLKWVLAYAFKMAKISPESRKSYWWKSGVNSLDICKVYLKPGCLCPNCKEDELRYDALFILACYKCGYIVENGAFT